MNSKTFLAFSAATLALTGTACLLGGRSQPQQGPQPRPLRE